MTEQELEEKIKDKFESVCEKMFRLETKYSDNPTVLGALSIIACTVGEVLGKAHLQLTEDDRKYPHLFRTFLNSRPNNTQQRRLLLPPMSLQECADFMERADKTLDVEEKFLELAEQIKKELKND